jgi:hypothetical protein
MRMTRQTMTGQTTQATKLPKSLSGATARGAQQSRKTWAWRPPVPTFLRSARTIWLSALSTVAVIAVLLVSVRSGRVAAQAPPPAGQLLTATAVLTALQQAGLPVENAREDPLGSSPSGPPATEREAWSFAIPSVAPSGGRIMVFEDDRKLQVKGAWFRRAGATVAVHRNVILWLDPALDPSEAARYRQALQRLG